MNRDQIVALESAAINWREAARWHEAVGEGDDLAACEALAAAGLMTSGGTKAWHAGGDERLTMFKVTTLGAAEVGVTLGG